MITKAYTFSAGTVIVAAEHNANFDGIIADYNGNVTNANVAAAAAIAYTKLDLSGKIMNSDINASAAIAETKINFTTGGIVPSGGIIMWSGTIANIPTGWFLCDGNNSTPNLTNRFIVCADADDGGVAKSTITGSALQSHDTGFIPAHTHAQGLAGNPGQIASGSVIGTNGDTGSYGTGTKVISVFYALAYIMKS